MSDERIQTKRNRERKSQIIYDYIRKEKSVSKQDIMFSLKLSLPTITQNLQCLAEMGLIDTSKKIENTGGRNATAYTYVKDAKMAMGMYITGHHINVVAVDLSGNVVEMLKINKIFNLEDERYLQELGEAVETVKVKAKISDDNLLGVGIAIPSLVSEDGEEIRTGMTLDFSNKARADIAKYIPYKNRLFHDSRAAGYAEAWLDGCLKDAFYLSLSNSVGGSVIISESIHEGNAHKAGEIGHMIVIPQGGEQCYCGKYGCFDTVCRSTNLDQYTDGNLEQFFVLLEKGDEKAKELWDEYLDYLAMGIHNARMMYDCPIIIGGYVGVYIGEYMDELCQRVDERDPFGESAKEYVVQCKYKTEATAAGAAIVYIDSFFDSI